MKKMINALILTCFFCGIIVFFVSCAAEGGPSGGPEDKTGPDFISSDPIEGDVNVSRTPHITLIFSEPIDYRTIENTLKIFPELSEKPTIKVSKNEVKIIPDDSLDNNTTYIFSFGRSLQDFQKNKTKEEIRLAFSTGDVIDNSCISGQVDGVFDEKKPVNILIYRSENTFSDSIIFQKPQYMTTVDNYGSFYAGNLATGNYRIFAIEGNYDNFQRVTDDDQIGLPTNSFISINTKSDTVSNISLMLNKYYMNPFRLINSKQKDGFLELNLSYPITLPVLNDADIFISEIGRINQFWLEEKEDNTIKIRIPGRDSCQYRIDINNLMDLEGRIIKHAIDSIVWIIDDEVIDSIGASVQNIFPKEKKYFFLDSEILFDFSEPVLCDTNIEENIHFIDCDSNEVEYYTNWIDANTLIINPENLKPSTNYSLELFTSEWKDYSSNTNRDSVITYKFRTVNPDTFGIISGTINSDEYELMKLLIGCNRKGRSETIQIVRPDSTGNFTINKLMPDDYNLFVWYDFDEDHEYDKGKLIPFELPEKIKFYSNPITVRSRWETEEVQLKF